MTVIMTVRPKQNSCTGVNLEPGPAREGHPAGGAHPAARQQVEASGASAHL